MAEFDIAICGAGPCGATTGYYLARIAKEKGRALKIALLDKATFPRDKFCGDAWCAPALEILEDMGVLQDLECRGLVCETLVGGFVSPSGYSFIANDRGATEKNMSTRASAIKRIICDEAIARKAQETGCDLIENFCVEDAALDETRGIWTVRTVDGKSITCSILVAADGAASNLARRLGIVLTAPDGVAARQYVKAGTHNFKADGVLLYPEYTLPGYMALFRHYDDTIDLGAYLVPGGVAKEEDIAHIYETKIRNDPFISRALGPRWEPAERVKVASLRLGGVKQSFGERFFIVGDAAGQVDPLTGEGIHTGMVAGRICAETIVDMFERKDFSIENGERYHKRWWNSFGSDFPMSSMAAKAVYTAPFLMDAVPIAAAAKGTGKSATSFFADFGAVMTGAKPKTTFLNPFVAVPLMKSTLGVLVRNLFGWERGYYDDPSTLNEQARITSWDAQCLIDRDVPVGHQESDSARMDKVLNGMFAWGKDKVKGRLPVLVAFGTEYGFSSELATRLGDALSATGKFIPRKIDLAHYKLIDFSKEKFLFVIISTAGDGDPPVEVRDFFLHVIENSEMKRLSESVLFGAVLALGDKAYPKFCAAGTKLAKCLQEKQVISVFMGEEEEGKPSESLSFCQEMDGDRPTVYQQWINQVVSAAVQRAQHLGDFESRVVKDGEDYLYENARQSGGLLLKEKRATKDEPFMAKVKSKRKLTSHAPCGPFEDKWHIVLDISGSEKLLEYAPGDALGVLPRNDPVELTRLFERLFKRPEDITKEILEVALTSKNIKELTPDICEMLFGQAQDPREEWNERWVSDVLDDLLTTKRKLNGNKLIHALKDLPPRFYSIASSPLKDKDEIHLCVAAVRYEIRNRVVGGVASTYLIDRLQVGDSVPVFVQRNPDFRVTKSVEGKEESLTSRKLMIGPGTGVAPFRAFARHESALGKQGRDRQSLLFFGCRYEQGDFLYSDEWKDYPYEVVTAFSRDTDRKVYVQHRIHAMRDRIWSDFLSHGDDCQIYICGDGWNMAKDVEDALVDIAVIKGSFGGDKNKAREFVKSRTHLDVWVV